MNRKIRKHKKLIAGIIAAVLAFVMLFSVAVPFMF